MKRLIVTGDDFGISIAANEAIERAHRQGILTAASLMVGAEAVADAVERARRLPTLRIGLHLALVDGRPILSADIIPGLVDRKGNFSSHLVRAGFLFFFSKKVKRQLEAEIHAQFQAFQRTGLPLDHVNAHHHMQLHPTVSQILLKVGKEYGVRAIRLPYEPPIHSWRASGRGLFQRVAAWVFLSPWIVLLGNRIAQERVCSNDFVFGMYDSGKISMNLVLRLLRCLPDGVTEICFHPAIPKTDRTGEDGGPQKELEALTSPSVREAVLASGIQLIAFSDQCEPY